MKSQSRHALRRLGSLGGALASLGVVSGGLALGCGFNDLGGAGTAGSGGATPAALGGASGAGTGLPGGGASSGGALTSGGAGPGSSGSPATSGASGSGGGGPVGVPVFKNYEYTGTWPQAPIERSPAAATLSYTKIPVHARFLAESCSIADYNNDGNPDISSGRRWYAGPFVPGQAPVEHIFRGTPVSEYGHDDLPNAGDSPEIDTGVSDDWADFPFDMDGDGLTDIINIANCDVPEAKNPSPKPGPQPKATAYWYKNPGAAAGDVKWNPYVMHNDVRLEQHGLVDVNSDGYPEFYGACKGCSPATTKGYYQGDKANPTAPWTYHPVTKAYEFPFGGYGWLHGMGFGDVNGDGTPDLLERGGAWVNVTAAQPNVTLCPGAGCGWLNTPLYDNDPAGNRGPSHMYAADVDGDNDADIVAADWAHGWGLAWYEQTTPGAFTKRQFQGTNSAADVLKYGPVYMEGGIGHAFSEPHALQVADMNGDGVPDVITGKMRFAHPISYGDPDPMGQPVVVVFEGKRQTPSAANGGSVTFVPHVVDMQVGVGRQLAVGFIDGDSVMDICIASKLGLYVFLGQ